jgi:hypothetical protein
MKPYGAILTLSFTLVLVHASSASGATLYDTTIRTPAEYWLVGKSTQSSLVNQPAEGFILSGGSFRLDQITLALSRSAESGDFAVRFWRDAGGKPGTLLESWSVSGSIPSLVMLSSVSHPTLNSGIGYWVSAALPDNVSSGLWQAVNYPTQGSSVALSNSTSATWFFASRTNALSLKITGTPVPEPSTLVLGCAGGAATGLVLLRRRRWAGTQRRSNCDHEAGPELA